MSELFTLAKCFRFQATRTHSALCINNNPTIKDHKHILRNGHRSDKNRY